MSQKGGEIKKTKMLERFDCQDNGEIKEQAACKMLNTIVLESLKGLTQTLGERQTIPKKSNVQTSLWKKQQVL